MTFIICLENMEEINKDDLFKKILEMPPRMRPDLKVLEDMNRRLDAAAVEQDKKRGLLWWWVIPLLLLPFIFGTFFFYSKYEQAKKTIIEKNLQLTTLSSTIQKNQLDTAIQRLTVYQYDTVYSTVYQDVIVKRKIEQSNEVIVGNQIGFYQSFSPALATNTFKPIVFSPLDDLVTNTSTPSSAGIYRNDNSLSLGSIASLLSADKTPNNQGIETVSKTDYDWSITLAINSLSFLNNRFEYERPLPPSDHFFALSTKKGTERINPLWYFVPTGFQAGINWSPVSFLGTNFTGKSIGLTGEVEFTKNTRLQFGLDFLTISTKANSPDEFNHFPRITPNDPTDFYKEIYGDFTYFQVPLTLKYVLQPDKKWRPFWGIGLIARLPLKEQFRHEFISVQGGEYRLTEPLNEGAFSVKNMRGAIGVEYSLRKNISLQGEGFYNYEFGAASNPYFNLRYGGVNLNLKYKF